MYMCSIDLVVSDTLLLHGLWPTKLLCPRDSPGKNTRVGCYAFLQGIFSTQVSNPGLLYCKQLLYHLSHQGSPSTLLRLVISLQFQLLDAPKEHVVWSKASCCFRAI